MEKPNKKEIENTLKYINNKIPNLENLQYKIREDGKIIKFTADNIVKEDTENLSEKSLKTIEYIEKTLNVKYKGITNINRRIYFNFGFVETLLFF